MTEKFKEGKMRGNVKTISDSSERPEPPPSPRRKSENRPNWLKFVSEANYCKVCGNILGLDPNKACWLCERMKEHEERSRG